MPKLPRATDRDAFEISPSLAETIGWLVMVVALALAAADVMIGPWDHDSGSFLLHGAYIAEGLRPYLDFDSIYPPLFDLITAFFVRLGLSRLLIAAGLPLVWIFANSLASAFLAWRLTRDRGTATLVGALFPLFAIQNGGNHLTLEHGVVLFGLVAFAAIAGDVAWSPSLFLISGACAAASTLCKQNGAVVLLPIGAALWARREEVSKRLVGAFTAGLVSVPLALLAWLRFDVAAIYSNTVSDLGKYTQQSQGLQRGTSLNELSRAPATFWLFVLAAAAALAVIARRGRSGWVAAAALAGGVIEFLPRLLRDYPHYNLNMWPFLALVVALAASQPARGWRSAVCAVLLLFAPLSYGSLLSRPWRTPSALLTMFVPAAEAIEIVTPPDGVVRQYGSQPILEFLSGRREELLRKPPVIYSMWDGSGVYQTPPSANTTVVVVKSPRPWFPELMNELHARGFRTVAEVGRTIFILRKR